MYGQSVPLSGATGATSTNVKDNMISGKAATRMSSKKSSHRRRKSRDLTKLVTSGSLYRDRDNLDDGDDMRIGSNCDKINKQQSIAQQQQRQQQQQLDDEVDKSILQTTQASTSSTSGSSSSSSEQRSNNNKHNSCEQQQPDDANETNTSDEEQTVERNRRQVVSSKDKAAVAAEEDDDAVVVSRIRRKKSREKVPNESRYKQQSNVTSLALSSNSSTNNDDNHSTIAIPEIGASRQQQQQQQLQRQDTDTKTEQSHEFAYNHKQQYQHTFSSRLDEDSSGTIVRKCLIQSSENNATLASSRASKQQARAKDKRANNNDNLLICSYQSPSTNINSNDNCNGGSWRGKKRILNSVESSPQSACSSSAYHSSSVSSSPLSSSCNNQATNYVNANTNSRQQQQQQQQQQDLQRSKTQTSTIVHNNSLHNTNSDNIESEDTYYNKSTSYNINSRANVTDNPVSALFLLSLNQQQEQQYQQQEKRDKFKIYSNPLDQTSQQQQQQQQQQQEQRHLNSRGRQIISSLPRDYNNAQAPMASDRRENDYYYCDLSDNSSSPTNTNRTLSEAETTTKLDHQLINNENNNNSSTMDNAPGGLQLGNRHSRSQMSRDDDEPLADHQSTRHSNCMPTRSSTNGTNKCDSAATATSRTANKHMNPHEERLDLQQQDGDNDNNSDGKKLDDSSALTRSLEQQLSNRKQQYSSSFMTNQQQQQSMVDNVDAKHRNIYNRHHKNHHNSIALESSRQQHHSNNDDDRDVSTKLDHKTTTKTNHHELLSLTTPTNHDDTTASLDNTNPHHIHQWQSTISGSNVANTTNNLFYSEHDNNNHILVNRLQTALARQPIAPNVAARNSQYQPATNRRTLATFQKTRHISDDYSDNQLQQQQQNNSLFLVENSNRTTVPSSSSSVMMNLNSNQQQCYNFNTGMVDDHEDHLYQDIQESENQINNNNTVPNHYQSPLYTAPSFPPHYALNNETINHQQELKAKLSKNPWLMSAANHHQKQQLAPSYNQQPLIPSPGTNPDAVTTLITPANLEHHTAIRGPNASHDGHVLSINHNSTLISDNHAKHAPFQFQPIANLSSHNMLNQPIGLSSQMLRTFNHSSLVADKALLGQHYEQKRQHETSTSRKLFKSILGQSVPVNQSQPQLNSNGTTSASSPSTSSCYGDSTTSANHFTQHLSHNHNNKIILMSNSRGSFDSNPKQRSYISDQNLGYYHKVTPTKFRGSSALRFILNPKCGAASENRLCFYLILLLMIVFVWLGIVITKYDLWPRRQTERLEKGPNSGTKFDYASMDSYHNATILFEGIFNLRPHGSYMITYPNREVTIPSSPCHIKLDHQLIDPNIQFGDARNMSSPLVNFLFMAMINKPPTLSDNIIMFSATTHLNDRMQYQIFKWPKTPFSDEVYLPQSNPSYVDDLMPIDNNQQFSNTLYNSLPSMACLQPGNWWFYALNNNDRVGIKIKLRILYQDRSSVSSNPPSGVNRPASQNNNGSVNHIDGSDVCSSETCQYGECSASLQGNNNSSCNCHEGWTGIICDERVTSTTPAQVIKQESREELRRKDQERWAQECDSDCQEHGVCINGTCYCLFGWTGPHCKTKSCPNDCSYNGHCVEKTSTSNIDSIGYSFMKRQLELNQFPGDNTVIKRIFLVKNVTKINDKLEYRYQYNPNGQQWLQSKSDEFKHPQRISQNLKDLANDLNSPVVITLFDNRNKWTCSCHSGYSDEDCSKLKETDCSDGKDNDSDGLVDCYDSECCSAAVCKEHMSCLPSPDPVEILNSNKNQLWLPEETSKGTSRNDISNATMYDNLIEPQTYSFYEKVKFLIKENSVQQYAIEKSFDKKHVAVIRGRVVWQGDSEQAERGGMSSTGGKALIAVRVGVEGSPDLGFTLTRQDGWFDLLVNGGNYVTLHLMKDPYISVKRNIYIKINSINVIPPIIMIIPKSTNSHQSLSSITGDRFVWPYDAHSAILKYSPELYSSVKEFTSNHCFPGFNLPDIRPRIIYEDKGLSEGDHKAEDFNYIDAPKISTSEALINNDLRNWHSGIYRESREIGDTKTNITYLSAQSAPFFRPVVKIDLFGDISDLNFKQALDALRSVVIKIVIEGIVIEERLDPNTDLAYLFAWNRRNIYNQKVYGLAMAYISVGYEYKVLETIKGCGSQTDSAKSFIHWSTLTSKLRGFDIDYGTSIGHWNIGVQHRYNIRDNILQFSDGDYIPFGELYPPVVAVYYQHSAAENNSSSEFSSLALGPNATIFSIAFNKLIQLDSHGQEILALSLPKFYRSKSVTVPEHYNLVYSPYDNSIYLSASLRRLIYKIPCDSLKTNHLSLENEERILDSFEKFAGGGLIEYQNEDSIYWQNSVVPASKVSLVEPKSMTIASNGVIFFVDGSHICSIDLTTRAINIEIKGRLRPRNEKLTSHTSDRWQLDMDQWKIDGPGNIERSNMPRRTGQSKMKFDVELFLPDNVEWNSFDKSLYFIDYNSVFRLKQNHHVQALIIGSQPDQEDGLIVPSSRLGSIQAIAVDDRGNLMFVSNNLKKRDSKNSLMKISLDALSKISGAVNYQDYTSWFKLVELSNDLTNTRSMRENSWRKSLLKSLETKSYSSYDSKEENIVSKTFSSITSLIIDNEGTIYLGDDLENILYRIRPFVPPTNSPDQSQNTQETDSAASYNIYVPKKDEFYEFDLHEGYHLTTRSGQTYQVLNSFYYKTYDIQLQSTGSSEDQVQLRRLKSLKTHPYLLSFEGKLSPAATEVESYQVSTILANHHLAGNILLDEQGYMVSFEEPKFSHLATFEYDNETKALVSRSERGRRTNMVAAFKLNYDHFNHLVSVINLR